MHILVTLIVSNFILGSHAFCGSLPRHDDMLTATITTAQRKAMSTLAEEESAYDQEYNSSSFAGSDQDDDELICPITVMQPADHLVEDLKYLANARNIITWVEEGAKKCRKSLKTKAAKAALGEIVAACSIEISDMEKALNRFSKKMPNRYPEGAVSYIIRELMESAANKCAETLKTYLMSGALLGKTYEQDDAGSLCDYARNILSVYDDFHEDSRYYGWLRDLAAQYYDSKKVSKNDIRDCFEALRVTTKFANKSAESADDQDLIVLAETAGEILDDFTAGLRIVHIDRNKFNVADSRLRFYLHNAPTIFSLCMSNAVPLIEGEFKKNSWASWSQANQTIWVDPKGVISVRVKTNGQITVGFLASNPHKKDKTLDTTLLGNRNTEELKLSRTYGEDAIVAIPATLDSSYVPFSFWPAHLNHFQRDKAMKYAHINK